MPRKRDNLRQFTVAEDVEPHLNRAVSEYTAQTGRTKGALSVVVNRILRKEFKLPPKEEE
jgi:hypothetical protein